MKKIAFITVAALLVLANKVFACSVSVNDNFQKNLLAAHSASHLSISLVSVTSTSILEYGKTFEGSDEFDCPQHLITHARINFKYTLKKIQKCEASVVVTRRQYMGNEIPDGPIEQLSFAEQTASCSTSIRLPL